MWHGPHSSNVVVMCVDLLLSVLFYVLCVCKCVLYYCHRVLIELQLTNLSYIISYIMSYHIISYHISYHIISYRIVSYRVISCHIVSYHIISYHIISYHINHISYHIISYIISLNVNLCLRCVGSFTVLHFNTRRGTPVQTEQFLKFTSLEPAQYR
jgi:hypothetical protein